MRTITAAASGPFDHYPHFRSPHIPLTLGQESDVKRLVSKLKQLDIKDKIKAGRRMILRHLWFKTSDQSFAGFKRALRREDCKLITNQN